MCGPGIPPTGPHEKRVEQRQWLSRVQSPLCDGSPHVATGPLFSRAQDKGIRELGSLREGLAKGGSESREPSGAGRQGGVETEKFHEVKEQVRDRETRCQQSEQTYQGAQFLDKPHLTRGVTMKP